jgi:hypothetical protein
MPIADLMFDHLDTPYPEPHWMPTDPTARAQFEALLRIVFTPPEQLVRLVTGDQQRATNGEAREMTTVPPPTASEVPE